MVLGVADRISASIRRLRLAEFADIEEIQTERFETAEGRTIQESLFGIRVSFMGDWFSRRIAVVGKDEPERTYGREKVRG